MSDGLIALVTLVLGLLLLYGIVEIDIALRKWRNKK